MVDVMELHGCDRGQLCIGAGTAGICGLPASLADRACLMQFGPDLVVSLTQDHEMRDAGAADLGVWLASQGIDWVHLPVPDFGVPGRVSGWATVQDRTLALLAAGGRVLVHCRAGRGRSGAMLLRLMVAAGEEGGAALTRLRAARPGAVETEGQRRWATMEDGAQDDGSLRNGTVEGGTMDNGTRGES